PRPARRRLQTHHPAAAGRHARGPAAGVGGRRGHEPGGHRSGRAATRPAGRATRIPGVASRAVGLGLGRRLAAELGHVRPPEEDQAGRPELRHEVRVLVLDPPELPEQLHPRVIRIAGRVTDDVLQQERHAAKEPVGKRRRGGLSPSLLEEGDDDRVQLAVETLDPRDRRVDELDGAHLPTLRERLGLHARSARDFFDALVALGMLERRGDAYANTPETGLFLDRAKPTYVGGLLEMLNARLYGFWGSLSEALRTGRPQNEGK